MFESCICIHFDEQSTLSSTDVRTARKKHTCVECSETIKPGEKYEYSSDLVDGKWSHHKTCMLCARIRDSLFKCGYYYGEVWDEIHQAHCGWNEECTEFTCICPAKKRREFSK